MQHLGVSSLSRKTNLVKSRSREIGCYDDGIAMNVDSYLGSAIAEVPVKFQSDWKGSNESRVLEASRDFAVTRPSA